MPKKKDTPSGATRTVEQRVKHINYNLTRYHMERDRLLEQDNPNKAKLENLDERIARHEKMLATYQDPDKVAAEISRVLDKMAEYERRVEVLAIRLADLKSWQDELGD